MKITFLETGWQDYLSHTDRRLVQRINALIADIQRNGNEGIGKPEPLKGELKGWWSRRIDEKHRLVYRLSGGAVEIIACRTHYGEH